MSKPLPNSKRTIQKVLTRVIRGYLKPGVSLAVRRTFVVRQPRGEVKRCWGVIIGGRELGAVIWCWDERDLVWETGMMLLNKCPQYRRDMARISPEHQKSRL